MPPPQIPADVAGAYGVNEKDVRFLTRVQNYIFAYQRDGTEFILRLTPDTHQSAEQVMAEVEWVNDLAARDPLRDRGLFRSATTALITGRNDHFAGFTPE